MHGPPCAAITDATGTGAALTTLLIYPTDKIRHDINFVQLFDFSVCSISPVLSFFSRNKTTQNAFLLIASLVFYALWDWRFLCLLAATILSTYYIGNLVASNTGRTSRKPLFIAGIVINLSILFFFKYFRFFIDTFNDFIGLFGISTAESSLRIILPIGISFYTFSALSYLIDIYQEKIKPCHDLLAYSAFVAFFPSLLSGPIGRAQKQLPQFLSPRVFSLENGRQAMRCIIWGAFIKLCIADQAGVYVDAVFSNIASNNGTTLILAQFFYMIQLYTDFAGYSLIAIGSGALLGISLQDNFNRPFLAKTVTEYWRRWHISLTTWFRDYIYFPLGGSKVPKYRWAINVIIVFTISGLWHGAAYTFIAWGFLHGVIMVIERLCYGDRIKTMSDGFSAINLARIILTFAVVTIVFVFFRADTIGDAVMLLGKIFTDSGRPFIDSATLIPACISFVIMMAKDISDEYHLGVNLLESKSSAIRYLTYVSLIIYILLIGNLSGGAFIYFQF